MHIGPNDRIEWQGISGDLTPAQLDRAVGAVLGSAVGDALGAGYEFGSAPLPPTGPEMIGGGLGNFAPGEWTDDTTMAVCIAQVAASGVEITTPEGLTAISRNFRTWFETHPPDIGMQTANVLHQAGPDPTSAALTRAAMELHRRTGHTAGNGSLMRTGPVALPLLKDHQNLTVYAARKISDLTHADDAAWQACLLWSVAIRHAITHGEFNIRAGLENLQHGARAYWRKIVDEAETNPPESFTPNGWVVTALQAAWSAIHHTPVPEQDPCRHYEQALATAIGIGNDTDTVAAVAGALLGARWGASAIPARWRRILHGYPGITGEDLVALATLAANGGPIAHGWPSIDRIDYTRHGARGVIVQHPHDDGVYLGDAGALENLADEIDAVVSLCLVGRRQVTADIEHVQFRLIDTVTAGDNPNLDYVITDAAQTIADLRTEGKTVFVHCAAGQSRTSTVATAYSLHFGERLTTASEAITGALQGARPNPAFQDALRRLQHDWQTRCTWRLG